MYLDLGRWITGSARQHGARVDPRPEEASLLQDPGSILVSAAA